jgi:hypothetical protein
MRTLSPRELLEIWEEGQRLHPIDRALTLLATACPERGQEELARLSIGQRDALLFSIQELTFGPRLEAFCECPSCGAELELSLNTADLLAGGHGPTGSDLSLESEGFDVRFRPPNSLDLAASVNVGLVEGDKELLRRCVLRATQGDTEVAVESLPEAVTSAIASRMLESDPLSEIQLTLDCPACSRSWSTLLDIGSFLWTELDWQAKNLLREVDILARSYGWSEAEVLSLSPRRRQRYIEMVT